MKYSISELCEIMGGELIHGSADDQFVDEIYFDTRKGCLSNNSLFVAIDGVNSDGHDHIPHAYRFLSTRHFLISKNLDFEAYENAQFIKVSNVIQALQKLAIHHRNQFDIEIIGITGSNGKTIIKEWIQQLAERFKNTVRSPGSYNSQLGVPLSVLKINEEHELGIFEAGISAMGEMKHLAAVINPKIGIISNIGPAHSAGFDSIDQKLEEKMALFDNAKFLIYCKDHGIIDIYLENKRIKSRLISWSAKDKKASYFVEISKEDNTTNLHFFGRNQFTSTIPFIDDISIENAIFAILAAAEIKVPIPQIIYRSGKLKTLKMRLELKQGINNCLLINDSYNSDIVALSAALNVLSQQEQKRANTLIISQIEESNIPIPELLSQIAELIGKNNISRVIAVGPDLFHLADYLNNSIEISHFPNSDALIFNLNDLEFKDENVLIKGARKFSLDKVFELLSIKVHQTILEIDLEAMRHNLFVYRSLLEKDTKLMVMMKASAYGSGSKELSRFLSFQHVDYIAVAYIDEGVELRKSGIQIPIMVMNPEEAGFHNLIKYELEPEIYSIQQLKQLKNYGEDSIVPIHLKLETGMNRLGLGSEALIEICNYISNSTQFRVESIFSHLVASEDPDQDKFTIGQINSFSDLYDQAIDLLGYSPDRHILNTNGISRFADYQFEMVRLGIGLHGISDDPKIKNRLQKVQTLKTRISQIKQIKKGETVGYGRNFKAKSSMRIATINIGYADGLPRNAGNENYAVLLNRKFASIIGNVCMDMTIIDINKIEAKVGDEVIIFGQQQPIETLAKACQTIPYEILTRISPRIHRIFSRE
jgi:alanine racemase